MSSHTQAAGTGGDLRTRAHRQLAGHRTTAGGHTVATEALGVLYELASSPATAPNALALLHELQVYQVELDLQDEELRRSRAELESRLARQTHLYDDAPVGCATVDSHTVLLELNRSAARLLGAEPGALRGQPLSRLLSSADADELATLLACVDPASDRTGRRLRIESPDHGPREILVWARADDVDGRFLLAFAAAGPR
jgi:PAS domain-containing protein